MTVLLATAVAALALLPLGYIVRYSADLGWSGIRELVFRERVAELLWNTLRLVGGTVAVCAVLGVGAAWLVERSAVPGRRVWHVLLVAPLAVPAFVNGYAWISLLPGLDTYGGALLVVSLSYFPFVYLPAVAAFRGLDPALEETARGLGLSTWAVFRRVQLPQLRVAVLGGSLLIALHVLAEFGALAMLRYPTFTTAIYDQYRATFKAPARPRSPGSSCCCACCCSWPSCGCGADGATPAPVPARPGRSSRSGSARRPRRRCWRSPGWWRCPSRCPWPASRPGWCAAPRPSSANRLLRSPWLPVPYCFKLVGGCEQRLTRHNIDIDARFLVVQIFPGSGGLGAVLLRYAMLLRREP